MATADEVTESLKSFADSCRENERLTAMIKDWNRTISIQATDTGSSHTLITSGGEVIADEGAPSFPDLTIQAASDTLTEIFYGELSPNEPYNDGSLRIIGSEDDIVRLDFVIAMLWE